MTVDVADGVSPFSYKATLTSDNLISIEVIGDESDKKVFTWIKHCLLPKLVKWCDQEVSEENQGIVSNVQSLSLVDIEEYNDLYNELKMKYGLEMVKVSIEHESNFSRFLHTNHYHRFGRKQLTHRNSFTRMWPSQHICC